MLFSHACIRNIEEYIEYLEYSSGILEGLEEFPTLSSEFLNLDSLCNWQGEIEDIDTDTLVR